jgi:hypothetical protein
MLGTKCGIPGARVVNSERVIESADETRSQGVGPPKSEVTTPRRTLAFCVSSPPASASNTRRAGVRQGQRDRRHVLGLDDRRPKRGVVYRHGDRDVDPDDAVHVVGLADVVGLFGVGASAQKREERHGGPDRAWRAHRLTVDEMAGGGHPDQDSLPSPIRA